MNKCEILPQEEDQDYRDCTDRFWVLKCSAFFFMNSKSRQSPALLHAPVCFPAPCVEEEKQEGGGERSINYPMLELMNIYLLMLHVGRG